MRLLILGGEACPPELALAARRAARGVEHVRPDRGDRRQHGDAPAARQPVTIGWPLHGWEVAIVDEAGEPVALGEPGELVIGGVGLGRYLDPQLDAERYAALPALGWERAYRTGDIVRETVARLRLRRPPRPPGQARRTAARARRGRGALGAPSKACVPPRSPCRAPPRPTSCSSATSSARSIPPTCARTWPSSCPTALVPLVVVLDELPLAVSGKVDRKALPWPLGRRRRRRRPRGPGSGRAASPARRPGSPSAGSTSSARSSMTAETDFFACGGSSRRGREADLRAARALPRGRGRRRLRVPRPRRARRAPGPARGSRRARRRPPSPTPRAGSARCSSRACWC